MDSEYDRKFEEMKKYIPFLENMIKRLESTSGASANPRQAQLDKIRSLRDLLLNKKKRMKMENLLKCEQVLINLYAKVEQRDTLSVIKKAPDPGFSIDPPTRQEKSDLEAVRNKLKTVVKRQEEVQETLPEILRVNEVEDVHTAGSKEPALFQRRPNKSSLSPARPTASKSKETVVTPPPSASKRNYTRVLVSPETSSRRWSTSESVEDKPLFSRRTPRRSSPRRYSPSYHKRDRKKSFKESASHKSGGFNITLKVPEDSLSSCSAKDILERIINCSDSDVDIDTLREIRKQILTELKKTGAKDDISELILKSYSKKKKNKRKQHKEVEEGELSDSESEVIQNVYGNLSGNLVLKEQNETEDTSDKDKSRKIQICLVLNSNKDNLASNPNTEIQSSDVAELEMYDKNIKEDSKTKSNEVEIQPVEIEKQPEVAHQKQPIEASQKDPLAEVIKIEDDDDKKAVDIKLPDNSASPNKKVNETNVKQDVSEKIKPESVQNKANFYKPLTENSESVETKSEKTEEAKSNTSFELKHDSMTETTVLVPFISNKIVPSIESELEKIEKSTEIPLLNEPTVPETPSKSTVSEIDILQALKNEILSETIAIPVSEASTPLLHQPKIIKVASAKEILPKKRISIENYKQKAVNPINFIFVKNESKEDQIKKPSLKLTEKECERFNIPKISFEDDSSDNDDTGDIQVSDVYSDLAPKSPECDDSSSMELKPPVIIPVDPVKQVPANRKADVDMRTLPLLSPSANKVPLLFNNIKNATPSSHEASADKTKSDIVEQSKTKSRPAILDPRVRRDMNPSQSPGPLTTNPERMPRPLFSNICQSPATDAVMTPNSRSYEMTPNHQSFEIEQTNKHVYAPTFSMMNSRDRETSVAKDSRDKVKPPRERKSRFEDIGDTSWSSSDVPQNMRYSDSFPGDKYNKGQRKDRYTLDSRDPYLHRSECPKTPLPSFGRSDVPIDKPMTPLHPFGRGDCPSTPSHSFGRSECPPTPSHHFGRNECPPTPSHSFGISDCPPTPNHSFGSHTFNVSDRPVTPSHTFGATECPPTPTPFFGRNDCPLTPIHQFGRSDCPSTPKHPFGMHDGSQTPNSAFGRSETTSNMFGRSDYAQKYTKDPRLNRKPEYESNSQFDERDRAYYKDRGYSRGSSYKSQKPFNDTYQNQDREQRNRNSKYKYYAPDLVARHNVNKEQPKREQSVGRSMPKDYENERLFTRERGRYSIDKRYDDRPRSNQRERSVGRNVYPDVNRERSVGRHPEDNVRSSSRAPSVGRNISTEQDNNTLSVKSHAGRSFTIDTSVNATFQSFLESGRGIQVFEYNFDARRQRAASVGRSLVRDSSVGRPMCDDSKQVTPNKNKREGFRRAASVGRDLVDTAREKKSFQEIKADFRSYRHPVKEFYEFDTGKIKNIDTKSKNSSVNIDRSRRDLFEKQKDEKRIQSTSKTTYSPRKNYRDPRMRKESKKQHNNDRYDNAKKSGIVYSNDNIVKGAILASGYGVKNYKIPKIKRAVEEKEAESSKKEQPGLKKEEAGKEKRKNSTEKRKDEVEIVREKPGDNKKDPNIESSKQKIRETPKEKLKEMSKDKKKETPALTVTAPKKNDDSRSDSDSEKLQILTDDSSISDEQNERRLTRSSRKTALHTSPNAVTRTRKSKKSIISDSDSDTENNTSEKLNETSKTNTKFTTPTPTPPQIKSPLKEKKVGKKPTAVDIDTNFGLDELEMFSDNVVSDPVLDNINALIADLDNDLNTTKSESSNEFTKEISLENMMQNITSPQEDSSSQRGDEISNYLKDGDNLTKASDSETTKMSVSGLNKANEKIPEDSQELKNIEDSNVEEQNVSRDLNKTFDDLFSTKTYSEGVPIQNDTTKHKKDESPDKFPLKSNNDDIVSTSEAEKIMISVDGKSKIDEQNIDGCSTPDSTINTDEFLEKPRSDESVADSTNEEVHSETNVTSTGPVDPKPSSSRTEAGPSSELGSLLTMLQDKSKLKQLLSMLGDGENEKIKKKLEKLSEIVSDDEAEDKTEQAEDITHKTSVPTVIKEVDKTETYLNKNEKDSQNKDDDTQVNEDIKKIQLHKDCEDKEGHEKPQHQDRDGSFEDFAGDVTGEIENTELPATKQKKKMPAKKSKFTKKGKGKAKKATSIAVKRVTRATAAVEIQPKPKKVTRELQKLHEDIKEMFIKDDILNATGIRMCRLAKMVDDKSKDETVLPEVEPVVILEKFKGTNDKNRDSSLPEKIRKKPGPKPKSKILVSPEKEKPLKNKPGPKSKTKNKKESDPYVFETESVGDTTTEKASDDESDDSDDSEISSLASSKSFGSTEVLADMKKKTKRKRRGWQDGVIKPKHKKKKIEIKLDHTPEPLDSLPIEKKVPIPDMNCFTDKNYCFRKSELSYACRLCRYTGTDIVHHYKNEHPHVEIPLSRMSPALAKEAIDQCKAINFQAVSKIPSEKYVCIFCCQEFGHNNSVLETFFWHVVSMHTGEYKNNCTECVNQSRCPYSLDIPPPPENTNGQLIGYICRKCNFTQLSLENLKTHVIVRHNDEQTAVYTINLSSMTKKALKDLLRRCNDIVHEPPADEPRDHPQEIREQRFSEAASDISESNVRISDSFAARRTPVIKTAIAATIQSKITFEADDSVTELSDLTSEGPLESTIKIERVDTENVDEVMRDETHSEEPGKVDKPAEEEIKEPVKPPRNEEQPIHSTPESEVMASQPSNDIMNYPHFKINLTETGAKEYICCINGTDNHFRTTLLISMKKHVQLKHSEKWDGYCFVCKVIVTPQGTHLFKECFQHYLDKHIDNFPIFEKQVTPEVSPEKVPEEQNAPEASGPSKPYIAVRPIYELISSTADETPKETSNFPIIQSVVSLTQHSSSYPTVKQFEKPKPVTFKYEEAQAQVMSNKHRVVLETMMARDKLVKVYKCAGRFCSFTSDSAEEALLHASTHQRIGGVDALKCCYCDFDAMENAIDLVMHVFRAHGLCQYSCGQCFYRAAASQSVAAHAVRVHQVAMTAASILRTTTVTNAVPEEEDMLTREEAVSYYNCGAVDVSGNSCKFRTYTPDKFCEHIHQKHGAARTLPCSACGIEVSSAAELVNHMKSHGLKLYQCTWCTDGADNEAELLAHVSMVHPTKQPQAYLRIITNKEGTTELRVLPLAFLNKMKVPTEDVSPSTTKENAVREAERSIDLEKLISLTMIVEPPTEPSVTAPESAVTECTEPQEDLHSDPVTPTLAPVETSTSLPTRPLTPVSMAVSSILSSSTDNQPEPPVANPAQTVTLAVKVEPSETSSSVTKPTEVVVLDSDEEDAPATQSVIDVSDDDLSVTSAGKKVPIELLSTCPKCRQVYKSMNGLKKHMYYCYPNKEEGCRCPHCPYIANTRDNILQHYMDDHCDRNIYQCGECRVNLMSLKLVKKHVRYIHKAKELTVNAVSENGIMCFSVHAVKKEKREQPKRKLSSETPKKRYGPQDINQLPINPILDQLVYCEICEFSTKVRLNMVRHLQLHAEQQPVAQTAPVNPVPHLETNEKYFDRMVNLASSSITTRAPEKPQERGPYAMVPMSAELGLRYPKQANPRERNTCGAPGCSYTAVDEATLRRHWDALHLATASTFRCVHCPNNQMTDTSRPITAARVIAHLKMHDDTLYACSKCSYYHCRRDFMERHLNELHPDGHIMVVRDGSVTASTVVTASAATAVAPTMDLKPWQCGLCQFKSMLRPEVVEHCFKFHQSKMQYRCGYCPYRASALENVNNHLAHSHAKEPEEVIYYYYREGSFPDAADGTPRWLAQQNKLGANVPEVKTEERQSPEPTPPTPPVNIDLNLVKKEVVDTVAPEKLDTMEDLCKKFGEFCEPNGIKYKCPLCTIVMEDTREAMQSHLFEELQYRKWGCGLCNYKAFHKAGLTEHMTIEHRRQYDHIELPTDINKEKWVAGQLDHQGAIIDRYKANLAKQKITVERSKPGPSTTAPPTVEAVEKFSTAQLEEAFGEFGTPNNMMFCCPKCGTFVKDEAAMRDHLEMELNKIRWGCTNCSEKYQTYHEAQFHCKGHDGPSRPKEAIRDPSMRAAWVNNIIQFQRKILQSVPATPTIFEPPTPEKSFSENDNSLLVVRYEERVPTPDQVTVRRKRPAPESDEDERLIIDEQAPKRKHLAKACPHCPYKCKHYKSWKEHVLKHFNLKPYSCCYCDYTCTYRQGVTNHTERHHPNEPLRMKMTAIPPAESHIVAQKKRHVSEEDVQKLICLFCEKSIPEDDVDTHLHENIRPDFAKKGDVVVKCCICLVLRLDVKSLQDHHNQAHPNLPVNYALFKLHHETREIHYCGYCDDVGFKFLRDLKSHHKAVHPTLIFKYTTVPYAPAGVDADAKRKEESPVQVTKSCARKSTTKLPGGKTVARKSTTKLPYSVPNIEEGYSYYKSKPEPLEAYANVTTLMSFCNRMMPFTMKKLSEIINLEPKVVVKDIRAGTSSDVTL